MTEKIDDDLIKKMWIEKIIIKSINKKDHSRQKFFYFRIKWIDWWIKGWMARCIATERINEWKDKWWMKG